MLSGSEAQAKAGTGTGGEAETGLTAAETRGHASQVLKRVGKTQETEVVAEELREHKLRLSTKRQSDILTEDMLVQLGACIPPVMRTCEWDVAYKLSADGTSMQTFYSKLKHYNPTIVVVQDTHRCLFGAYTTEGWHRDDHFYGTGESFVFKFNASLPLTA